MRRNYDMASVRGGTGSMARGLDIAFRWLGSCLFACAFIIADPSAGGEAASQDLQALERAAEGGDAEALFRLGDMHERADGVEHSVVLAAAYMRLAAERGSALAQYRLGLYHAAGLGLPEDPVEAYKWLTIASGSGAANADAGNAAEDVAGLLATTMRSALAARMSDADISLARDQAAAYRPESMPAELPFLSPLGTVEAVPTLATIQHYLPRGGCGELSARQDAQGRFRVAGYLDEGMRLSDAGARYFERHSVAVDLVELDRSLCRVIGLAAAEPASLDTEMPLALRNKSGEATDVFRDGDHLIVEHPGFEKSRYVAVDYFTHDGQVLHMFPTPKNQDNFLPADRPLLLGDPQRSPENWQIGPPFGRDLLLVIASGRPVYDGIRPQVERTVDYVAALRRGFAGMAGGDAVRTHYRVVTTVAR